MIVDSNNTFVEYFRYCKKCKYFNKNDYEEPCHECLENPAYSTSEVPLKYEQKVSKNDI